MPLLQKKQGHARYDNGCQRAQQRATVPVRFGHGARWRSVVNFSTPRTVNESVGVARFGSAHLAQGQFAACGPAHLGAGAPRSGRARSGSNPDGDTLLGGANVQRELSVERDDCAEAYGVTAQRVSYKNGTVVDLESGHPEKNHCEPSDPAQQNESGEQKPRRGDALTDCNCCGDSNHDHTHSAIEAIGEDRRAHDSMFAVNFETNHAEQVNQ